MMVFVTLSFVVQLGAEKDKARKEIKALNLLLLVFYLFFFLVAIYNHIKLIC